MIDSLFFPICYRLSLQTRNMNRLVLMHWCPICHAFAVTTFLDAFYCYDCIDFIKLFFIVVPKTVELGSDFAMERLYYCVDIVWKKHPSIR